MDHNDIFTIFPVSNQGTFKFIKYFNPSKARGIYFGHSVDLLTGKRSASDVKAWLRELETPLYVIGKETFQRRAIILFYELGFIFENLENLLQKSSRENVLLAVDIVYQHELSLDYLGPPGKIDLKLVNEPDFSEYQKAFNLGYKELEAGNCYQFNLTKEYLYSYADDSLLPKNFLQTIWFHKKNCGAYANATFIPILSKFFLSNSPECLFQYERNSKRLVTRPIKGTLKIADGNAKELKFSWEKLVNDEKAQAELFMISDLMRNDLSRIDLPLARVIQKKAMLNVPGLLHQYSEIEVFLKKEVSLKRVLEKIYPGGSVTGAPKKRAISILKNLENRDRGFYTGSTLLFFPRSIVSSLNIRSMEIDLKAKMISYQAGGGITLLSDVYEEFQEMSDKRDSVINLFNLI